jgi:hypothetical protein
VSNTKKRRGAGGAARKYAENGRLPHQPRGVLDEANALLLELQPKMVDVTPENG